MFDDLDETEFEEFCFQLLGELGFVNIDWRKGTGLSTSPADRGRDIVSQLEREDIDGTRHLDSYPAPKRAVLDKSPVPQLEC